MGARVHFASLLCSPVPGLFRSVPSSPPLRAPSAPPEPLLTATPPIRHLPTNLRRRQVVYQHALWQWARLSALRKTFWAAKEPRQSAYLLSSLWLGLLVRSRTAPSLNRSS